MQPQYSNVKVLHVTKQHGPDDPITVAFSGTEVSTGKETILTAEIRNPIDLFHFCADQNYLNLPQTSRWQQAETRQARGVSA